MKYTNKKFETRICIEDMNGYDIDYLYNGSIHHLNTNHFMVTFWGFIEDMNGYDVYHGTHNREYDLGCVSKCLEIILGRIKDLHPFIKMFKYMIGKMMITHVNLTISGYLFSDKAM